MYFLYFNEETEKFKIIAAGVTITEHYDGKCVAQSESKEYLKGLAVGFFAGERAIMEAADIKQMIAYCPEIQEKED